MQAILIERPRSARLVDVPVPEPAAGQVLVEIEGCGVCGSDLSAWLGASESGYPRPPGAPGHESWGRIAAVGDGVHGLSVGDRVATLAQRAYAQYDLAGAETVVPLPPALDGKPFPGEALACGVNASHRAAFRPGESVAVVGVGFLGAIIVQLAKNAGARVIVSSRRRYAQRIGLAMGADEAIGLDEHTVDRVKEWNGGELCDCVVEVTGVERPLDVAGRLTKIRGRLVIAGYHQGGRRSIDLELWNWRGLDVVNAHERDPAVYARGMAEAVDAVVRGDLDPSPLYTDEFALADAAAALEKAADRPDGFLKALLRP
ncbi:MAG TPA: alcohol dehydrogenase catalytic domain-containing protein [Solirubrobacteraceae bacterium]|nr:alcohol dehydrogenase catalytic domain-containing protein [Solirubrobacteraceae bacterium]